MTYILVIIGAALCMAASAYVKSTFRKYNSFGTNSNFTGADVAKIILQKSGITDVQIGHIKGELTDHYNPGRHIINLSDSVYDNHSVAAVAVAAHECGHVVQHHVGYLPIKLRTALVPLANVGSKLGLPMILIGIALGGLASYVNEYGQTVSGGGIGALLCTIGIWAFALGTAFQIVTLPVEFDASHRALKMLDEYGILNSEELGKGRAVLTAAALTYVAAAASSILQLIRIILIAKGGNRRRRF